MNRETDLELELDNDDSDIEAEYKEFAWCCHCERASRVADWKAKRWNCPLDDCDGNLVDMWSWESLRSQKPELPETPEIGALYPLYD